MHLDLQQDSDLRQQIAELRRELELRRDRENLLTLIEAVTRPAMDPSQIVYDAMQLLGLHLRVERCAYAEVGQDQDTASVIADFVDGLAAPSASARANPPSIAAQFSPSFCLSTRQSAKHLELRAGS